MPVPVLAPLAPLVGGGPGLSAGVALVGGAAHLLRDIHAFRRGPVPLPPVTGREAEATLSELIADAIAGARVPVSSTPPNMPDPGRMFGWLLAGTVPLALVLRLGFKAAGWLWGYLGSRAAGGEPAPGDRFTLPLSLPAGGYLDIRWGGFRFTYRNAAGETIYVLDTGSQTGGFLQGPCDSIEYVRAPRSGPGSAVGSVAITYVVMKGGGLPDRSAGVGFNGNGPGPEGTVGWEYTNGPDLLWARTGTLGGPVTPLPWPSPSGPPVTFPPVAVGTDGSRPAAAAPVAAPRTQPRPPAALPAPRPDPAVAPEQTPAPGADPAPAPLPYPQPAPPSPAPVLPVPSRVPTTTPTREPAPVPQPRPLPVPARPAVPAPATPTQPDGTPAPAPPLPVPTTVPGQVAVGSPARPITLPPISVPASLAGVAAEVGKLERKLEVVLGDDRGGRPEWMDWLENLKGLAELAMSADPSGAYVLSAPCEMDEDGDPIIRESPWPASMGDREAIVKRLDALAHLLQAHKDLKQPVCPSHERPQITGEFVSVRFREVPTPPPA